MGWISDQRVRRTGVGVVAILVWTLVMWLTPPAPRKQKIGPDEGDRALFAAVVRTMQSGQGYYAAMGSQLRDRGYPAGSVFNWRQPLLFEALAFVTPLGGVIVLVGLALTVLFLAGPILRRELPGPLMMLNALAVVFLPGTVYSTEVWAGVCIALSVLAYAKGRKYAPVGWGVLALFVRELAAVYCLIATVIAMRNRRWREVGLWLTGGAVYVAYFSVHVWQVLQHGQADDFTHTHSWINFGGFRFLFHTWQANLLSIIAPRPVFALFVVALIGAWWSPRMPVHVRATVAAYSLCFLFIGLPFNWYWGFIAGPTIGIWMTYAPVGLQALWGRGMADQPLDVASAA